MLSQFFCKQSSHIVQYKTAQLELKLNDKKSEIFHRIYYTLRAFTLEWWKNGDHLHICEPIYLCYAMYLLLYCIVTEQH